MATSFIQQKRKFTDIPFSFVTNPFTRDIVKKVDEEAIKQSVQNLIRTRKYERPFHPEISSEVEGLLFENFTPITAAVLKKSIEDVLVAFEPRIRLIDIKIDASQIDLNEIRATITYQILNSFLPTTVTVLLSRVR